MNRTTTKKKNEKNKQRGKKKQGEPRTGGESIRSDPISPASALALGLAFRAFACCASCAFQAASAWSLPRRGAGLDTDRVFPRATQRTPRGGGGGRGVFLFLFLDPKLGGKGEEDSSSFSIERAPPSFGWFLKGKGATADLEGLQILRRAHIWGKEFHIL